MSTVLNAKKRKCDVTTNGPIAELGFVNGPVFNCKLTTKQIISLVSNGKKVYEINPLDANDKTLLTIATCGTSVYDEVSEPVETNVTPPVVEIPKDVVMEKSQEEKTEETDPHKAFLASIGYTEDQWRKLNKSERKRLKAQHTEHVDEIQGTEEDENVTKTINDTPVEEKVENNLVVEGTTSKDDETTGENETNSDEVNTPVEA